MNHDDLVAIRARHAATLSQPWTVVSVAHSHADIAMLLTLVDEQAATIARLREALRWYADAANYEAGPLYDEDLTLISDALIAADWDEGACARAALVGAPDGEIGT